MRITLATPPYNLFKDGYGTKKSIKKGHMPPLGLGYVGSSLLEDGHEVTIVDPSANNYDFERAASEIQKTDPEAVGISAMTANHAQAEALAKLIKERTGAVVVIGGPHATCYPEELLNACPSADYVIAGEGERAIRALAKYMADGKKPAGLKGVYYKDGPSIAAGGKAEIETNLDSLPMPARHLYNNALYSPLPYSYRRQPATSMITSRGCPYSKCAFCFSAGKMKERFRRNSPYRVISEMTMLRDKYGIKEILFYDDNFIFDRLWIKEFCKIIKENKIKMSWSCAARADTVSAEMLKEIKEAGCWTVFYGFESGVDRLLEIIKKGITVKEIEQAVKWTHEAGLETRGSFMLGLPGETPEDGLKTIDFAVKLDLDYAQFTATFPDPGTELFEIAKKYGKIGEYRGMNKATFVPEGYSGADEVEKILSLAYKKFYFRPGYVIKRLKSIRNISDILRYIEGFVFLKGL